MSTTLKEIIKSWLVKEDQWKAKGFTDIVVVFADEPMSKTLDQAATQQPTLKLVP